MAVAPSSVPCVGSPESPPLTDAWVGSPPGPAAPWVGSSPKDIRRSFLDIHPARRVCCHAGLTGWLPVYHRGSALAMARVGWLTPVRAGSDLLTRAGSRRLR